MVLINDLTVVIVTYKTNDQILDECIQSILGKAKILVIENSDNKDFKFKYENKYEYVHYFLQNCIKHIICSTLFICIYMSTWLYSYIYI